MPFILFLVSLLASVVGAICGIGGGVIVKPVLDMFSLASVSAISFLSGCTVLAMSCYSVGKSITARESHIDFKVSTPLAVGAAVGGVVGKELFSAVRALFENQNTVGAVQGVCLALLTLGTLLYTLQKDKVQAKKVQNFIACLVIGLALGMMSSFLGIGGGPMNLVCLYYFFSMDTRTAAQNSLYIILFSQAASLVTTLLTHSVPKVEILWLISMMGGGLLGGILGRKCNKTLSEKHVRRLFIALMIVIICISIYNAVRFAMLASSCI